MKLETILLKSIYKITTFLISLILIPFSIFFHILGVRHFKVFYERIGHFAVEPDCLIKEMKLGKIKYKHIMALDKNFISNYHLLKYWKKYFQIYESKIMFFLVNCLSNFGIMSFDGKKYLRNKHQFQEAYYIYNKWEKRNVVLELNKKDIQWTNEMLIKLGLPKNCWYVVVHARTEGFSIVDDHIQNYRNSNINNMLLAVKRITDLGGWVIRIGDKNMPKLKKMKNVIDYAWSNLKSDRLDFCIIGKARFMIGNTSGITCLASVMGIPCAVTNVVPFSVGWLTEKDIFIPKLLWSNNLKRYLTYKEILKSEISNYNYSSQYTNAGINILENSETDILNLTNEMLSRIDQNSKAQFSGPFQEEFKHVLTKSHYGYFSKSRISKSFMKKYKELFL